MPVYTPYKQETGYWSTQIENKKQKRFEPHASASALYIMYLLKKIHEVNSYVDIDVVSNRRTIMQIGDISVYETGYVLILALNFFGLLTFPKIWYTKIAQLTIFFFWTSLSENFKDIFHSAGFFQKAFSSLCNPENFKQKNVLWIKTILVK